jgi:glyoxylase-like metal-dependent hydrolase (beta-lactamase superfamily II)
MKNLIKMSLVMMAISGCTSTSTKASEKSASIIDKGENFVGRVLEFKSGPEGFDTRTFFYEGKYEVIAFDSQFTPSLAKASIAYLRTQTDKPITWLVITHPNPDKFNGASEFKRLGTKIVASSATAAAIPDVQTYKEYFFTEIAKMFPRGQYPQPTAIDQTFSGEMDLVLRGGERIHLRELSQPGVSSTQTVANIESIGALFVGDLVHNNAHAWLEGGIVNGKATPAIAGWIADLHELKSLYPSQTLVYGGRGVTADLQTSVAKQIHYLQVAVDLIDRQLIKMGAHASDFNGPQSAALYHSLAGEFQAKFPDYDLAYMIDYGAYGLVQSELQKQ